MPRSQSQPTKPPQSDGRVHRSVVTRRKIVSALTALIYEGHLSPTAEQVAQRADIGLRTVFRHFDDMDSLYREINNELENQFQPMQSVRLLGKTWQDKLLHCIELRTAFYDQFAAIHLAGQVHRHDSSYVTENMVRAVTQQRELLMKILPLNVRANVAVFEGLDLLISMDSWIRLRRDQGLSATQAHDVLNQSVKALIAATP